MLKSIVKPKYVDGICFEKKEKIKRNEEKNQNFLSFFKNDRVKKINDNAEKNTAWWSIKGVPVVGQARIAMLKEYNNAKFFLIPTFKKKQ